MDFLGSSNHKYYYNIIQKQINALEKDINDNIATEINEISDNIENLNTKIKDNSQLLKDNARKNILINNAEFKTDAGMEFIVNEDKSITVNGTSTTAIYYYLNQDMSYLSNGIYIPTFDSEIEGKAIWCAYKKSDNNIIYCGVNDNKIIEITDDLKITEVYIHVNKDTTIENGTFYPMLRLQSISNSDYEPYYKTNKELTDMFNELKKPEVVGTTLIL